MLQRAAQRLACLPQSMLQAACYSSAKLPEDYAALVQKEVPNAKEIAEHIATPDKEIGMCAGVPLETFRRKVSGISNSSVTVTVPILCPRRQWATSSAHNYLKVRAAAFATTGPHLLISSHCRTAGHSQHHPQQQGTTMEDQL